jgi:non-specific serine/threonine protein kinase
VWLTGGSCWGLAVTALHLGRIEQASELLTPTLIDAQATGNQTALTTTLQLMGEIEWARGNSGRATELIEEALVMFHAQNIPWGEIGSLEKLAVIEQAHGRSDRALRMFAAAAAHREAIGMRRPPVTRAECEQTIAAIRADLGETLFATRWAEGSSLRPPEATAYALTDLLPSPNPLANASATV